MEKTSKLYEYPRNLVDMLEDSVAKFGGNNCIGVKKPDGNYEFRTYMEIARRIDNLRGGLAQLDIGKDDSVGLITGNSIEWAVIAFAIYGRNARLVPMYEKELEQSWKYIIKDSGLKVLFVINNAIYEKVKGYVDEIDTLEKIFIIDGENEKSMASIERLGEAHPIASIKPHWSDIAALIYTSGTTGDPKGVLLSHGNFTTNVQAISKAFPDINETAIGFSILPWAHAFGQTGELYLGVYMGASTGIMGSVKTLSDDIAKVRPTVLMAVPWVFNKVYSLVYNTMKEKGGFAEKLFLMANAEAAKKRKNGKAGLKFKILDKVVFGKIRKQFGGQLKLAITGSAAMNHKISEFYIDIGIPIYDCYGLTETSAAMTLNSPSGHRLGSVGKAIEKVTVVIDKSAVGDESIDGEIVCFGPNVMQGYHNKPLQTETALTKDPRLGIGFRSGDRGWLDKDGYLFITGRFKEEYKLENGKYVHPATLEEDIKLIPYVANTMVYGEGKPYNVCLVIPDFEALKKYARDNEITCEKPVDLVKNQKIQDFIAAEITRKLKNNYGGYEIPKKFLLISESFTIENGRLTQTMKVKRENVLEQYGEQLNRLYA